jgi:hypothetical protein
MGEANDIAFGGSAAPARANIPTLVRIEVTSKKTVLCLRRIGYRDLESGKHYEFLTNHFRLAAKTIAEIYRELWKIAFSSRRLNKTCASKTLSAILKIYITSACYAWLLSRTAMVAHKMIYVLRLVSSSATQPVFLKVLQQSNGIALEPVMAVRTLYVGHHGFVNVNEPVEILII